MGGGEHRGSDGTPIDIAELPAKAAANKAGKLARDAAEPSGGTGGEILAVQQCAQEALPAQAGRPGADHGYQPADLPRGLIFKAHTHLIGEHQLVTAATAFTMFSTLDGEESIYFPLPVRLASSKRLIPLWQVHGARIREPKPAWILKRIEYAKQC